MTEKTSSIWSTKKTSLASAIVAVVIFFIGGIYLGANWQSFAPYLGFKSTNSPLASTASADWSALNEVYGKLVSMYDGDINKTTLTEGAKKGLVASLGDPYTVYMDAEEADAFDDSLHGNVGGGIGIEFGERNGYPTVLRTLPDNPARRAGILAGDIIYKVNGEEVWNLDTEIISTKTRGEVGSEIELTIVRNGDEKTFTMTREKINNVSAYATFDGDTAIITITRFDTDTGTLVSGFAKEAVEKKSKKIILDLRDNGGGYTSAAKEILSLWIDGEAVFTTKSKNAQSSLDETTYAYLGKAILKDIKTIVLINGSTASASEITAGALKDYGLATIVGTQSYGKGVVQALLNLSGGTYLKVTTSSWYTPKGNSINKQGITPDIEVENTYDDINHLRDPQLDKAKSL